METHVVRLVGQDPWRLFRGGDSSVQGQDPREEVLESECTTGPQEMCSWLEGRNW